jgi:predicted ATPase
LFSHQVAYPALNTALGVDTHSTRKLPKRVLKECILSLFAHLLTKCPVVVVLEHIQLADEFSWEVLLELIGTVSYGLIVATAVMLGDLSLGIGIGDSATDATQRSLSRLAHSYKALTLLRSTILVKMSEYSVLDVDQLLCSVLDLDSCPTGTSAQVYQLSGGDPFWCKEMAQIIQSTGTLPSHYSLSCSNSYSSSNFSSIYARHRDSSTW